MLSVFFYLFIECVGALDCDTVQCHPGLSDRLKDLLTTTQSMVVSHSEWFLCLVWCHKLQIQCEQTDENHI
jgi:hypothetical protein